MRTAMLDRTEHTMEAPEGTTSVSAAPYSLLNHRARSIASSDAMLVVSDTGEYSILPQDTFGALRAGRLRQTDPHYDDLLAKHVIAEGPSKARERMLAAKLRTKSAFVHDGPSLHLFVVTLRCDHGCHYCQVSRQTGGCPDYDMSEATALAAVERVFESSARTLTVEFQGGEPLLAFPTIRTITEAIAARAAHESRSVVFTITSTLHHLSEEILGFFAAHDFRVSTSLDGPAELHNANRPLGTGDSHARTLDGIAWARERLGRGRISALTTLTRRSLGQPEAIVDAYIEQGFPSIFLRPLSPFGFAVRANRKIGYDMAEFVQFYDRALAHIIARNRAGSEIAEVYSGILLSHILTPFASRYVDLRSPAGAGRGVLVYNYDGGVYASDESRMLAEMGDHTFRLGDVHEPLVALQASAAMRRLAEAGAAEHLADCKACAYRPYCGADPVLSWASDRADYGKRPPPAHCARHMGLFDILFRHLAEGDAFVERLFLAWALDRAPAELHQRGVIT